MARKFEMSEEERIIVLEGFGLNIFKLNCQICNARLKHNKCLILPGVENHRGITVICSDDTQCYAEYLRKAQTAEEWQRMEASKEIMR